MVAIARTLTTACVAAGALVSVGVGSAGAVPAAGSPVGAVTFSAKNLGHCKAEFSIVNKTNVTSYTIDWRIDDEVPEGRDIGVGFPVWRTGSPNMASKADLPSWPDGGAGQNTDANRTMVSDRAPVTATYVQDLKSLNGWNPGLPNPNAATHKIAYRMVLGPPGNNGQTADGMPEWLGNREWRSVTVTGCAQPDHGSLGTGSLDSLFG
ncbi:MAG: hypothetical protein WBA38_13680 [Gordonia sp. (in: high G+C Gram-positive bacteria)]|uniref:hypothetical protein n=1 Tax=Gordonia sp. (in: high G+C Gram-positive bacteria) TaxID=84139 RepID=UPI003C776F47